MADKVPPDFSELYKSFDSLVNALNEDTSAIKDLPDNMASAMNNNNSSFEKSIEDLSKIMSALTGLNESVLKSSEEAQTYIKDLAKSAQDADKDRKNQSKNSEKDSNDLLGATKQGFQDANENLKTSNSLLADGNRVLGSVALNIKQDNAAIERAIGFKSADTRPMDTRPMYGPPPPPTPPADIGRGRFEFDDNDFFKRQGNQLNSYLAQLTGGVGLTQVLFTGAAKDAFIFQAALREVAFETQGIT